MTFPNSGGPADRGLLAEARLGSGRPPALVLVTAVDRSVEMARDRVKQYVRSTSISHVPVLGGADPLTQGYRDAADECSHGALPTDRVVSCGCWTVEVAA